MSLLGDFAGNFLSIAGNNMQQQEDQDRAIRLQEEIERRRFARQQNMKAKTSLPEQRPVGAPYQDPQSGKWLQRTQQARQALLDENTGDVTQAAAWEDGQPVEVADPNALTPYQQAQISQKELDRAAKIQAAKERRGSGGSGAPRGEDGLTAYQREQLKLQREREARLTDQGTRGNGGKKDTPDAVRKTWTETAAQISSADTQTLRSIAAQYGMDQRGLPSDDAALKDALLAQVDAEFGKRLQSSAGKARAPDTNDKTSPPPAKVIEAAREAIAKGADPAAVRKRVAEKLGIPEKDVQL